MNHIRKAEIVFPEISDRKIHVKRRVTVETGKQIPPLTDLEIFGESVLVVGIVTIVLFFLALVVITCGVKP